MFKPLLQKVIGAWHIRTFPDCTPKGHIEHMEKEIQELKKAFEAEDIEMIKEEASDLLIMLMAIAYRLDFNINLEAYVKFSQLRNRFWCFPNEYGVIEHVRVPGIGVKPVYLRDQKPGPFTHSDPDGMPSDRAIMNGRLY